MGATEHIYDGAIAVVNIGKAILITHLRSLNKCASRFLINWRATGAESCVTITGLIRRNPWLIQVDTSCNRLW
jgi:hypothetical protein